METIEIKLSSHEKLFVDIKSRKHKDGEQKYIVISNNLSNQGRVFLPLFLENAISLCDALQRTINNIKENDKI